MVLVFLHHLDLSLADLDLFLIDGLFFLELVPVRGIVHLC